MSRLSRWLPLIMAAAAVLVRLPFLVQSEAFFNSDEALEGLMARHVRELPVFFWGQGYKGVPEVYLTAIAFAIFGAGVVQLKAVTMAIWCGAVAVSTRLGQSLVRRHRRRGHGRPARPWTAVGRLLEPQRQR